MNCLGISIEKLENQLLQLKATFSEKEAMLENLKARLEELQMSKIVGTIPRCGPNSEYPVLGSDTSMSGFELQLIWLQLFALGLKEEASALIGSPQDQRKEHLSRWNPLTNQLRRKRSRKKSRNKKPQLSEHSCSLSGKFAGISQRQSWYFCKKSLECHNHVWVDRICAT